MDTSTTPESLWDFALSFYSQPQMAQTCLFLQDEHKINVCLLIGLHWLDLQGRSLSRTELVDLSAYITRWTSEIIEPLRALRRTLKEPFEAYMHDSEQKQLRDSIKQSELLAEKKLLIEIERWCAKISTSSSSSIRTHHNLDEYFTSLGWGEALIHSTLQKITAQ